MGNPWKDIASAASSIVNPWSGVIKDTVESGIKAIKPKPVPAPEEGGEAGGADYLSTLSENLAWQKDLARESLDFQKLSTTEMMDIAKRQQAIAEERYNYWKQQYQPIETQITNQAMVGLDPAYFAAKASADVGSAYDKAFSIQNREMMRLGIDPSSPKFSSLGEQLNLSRAAAEAGARTQAREQAQDITYQRRMNAAQLGQGIPSQTQAGLSSSAGITGQASGQLGQAYGQAGGMVGSALGALSNAQMGQAQLSQQQQQFEANLAFQRQQQEQANQAAFWQSIGSIFGMAGGAAIGAYAGSAGNAGSAGTVAGSGAGSQLGSQGYNIFHPYEG